MRGYASDRMRALERDSVDRDQEKRRDGEPHVRPAEAREQRRQNVKLSTRTNLVEIDLIGEEQRKDGPAGEDNAPLQPKPRRWRLVSHASSIRLNRTRVKRVLLRSLRRVARTEPARTVTSSSTDGAAPSAPGGQRSRVFQFRKSRIPRPDAREPEPFVDRDYALRHRRDGGRPVTQSRSGQELDRPEPRNW